MNPNHEDTETRNLPFYNLQCLRDSPGTARHTYTAPNARFAMNCYEMPTHFKIQKSGASVAKHPRSGAKWEGTPVLAYGARG
jgi:hypothetical protein